MQVKPPDKSFCEKKVLKTLPEAQRTQGIESETWIISEAKMNTYKFISVKKTIQVIDYRVNTLGPLCLWQCFMGSSKILSDKGKKSWNNCFKNVPYNQAHYKVQKISFFFSIKPLSRSTKETNWYVGRVKKKEQHEKGGVNWAHICSLSHLLSFVRWF